MRKYRFQFVVRFAGSAVKTIKARNRTSAWRKIVRELGMDNVDSIKLLTEAWDVKG